MTEKQRMRFAIAGDIPGAPYVVGRTYGADETDEEPRPFPEIIPICRICRCQIIGSEIDRGLCGHCGRSLISNAGGNVAAQLEDESL